MEHIILCLNAGSSSLKFAVYRMDGGAEARLFHGAVEAIGAAESRAWLRNSTGIVADQTEAYADQASAVKWIFAALQQQGIEQVTAAGHRIVHGGPCFTAPCIVDHKVRQALEQLADFAPLHIPGEVALIDAVVTHYPRLCQVACFDTAFHNGMPELAKRFALPEEFWTKGIRRYGFHGLSYEYVATKLGDQLGERAIIAHLGNGASMVALKDGQPIDTSMGLTPQGGFMMGTRTGDLDPGVLLYLLREGYSADTLQSLLNQKAGLLGVSGQSGDMKVLLENRAADPAADLAIRMFCYQVRKFIGAFAAALSGLETLVFTGGIGEHAAPVREEICSGLAHLGVELEVEKNACNAEIISKSNARCVVRMVPTDEDLMIARHTRQVLETRTNSKT